jgi:hypothetical protein
MLTSTRNSQRSSSRRPKKWIWLDMEVILYYSRCNGILDLCIMYSVTSEIWTNAIQTPIFSLQYRNQVVLDCITVLNILIVLNPEKLIP